MRVDDYSVLMNMEHFSYRAASLQTSNTATADKNFKSNDSLKTDVVESLNLSSTDKQNGIIKDLSASLLKSISDKTRVQDRFRLSATYIEAEALNFQTKAYIKTDDKEMEINLNVSLSRSFVAQMNIESVKALQDPLILNINGSAPSLSSKTFAFDIDSDGKEEQISMLGRGSVFLALDKNNNRRVDDGTELFGAKSGDGFEELRAYDDDKNGWIDENDKIFNKLRVWDKSEGKDKLIALGEVGIGAIFLGGITTPFELKTLSNEQLGVIRKSGFFLFESAEAGMISQIDLAVSQKEDVGSQLFINAKEGLKKLQGINSYKGESNEDSDSMEKRLEKLQKLLKSLEAKLNRAPDEQKAPLQAQIGAVYAQMMSLISKNL